ISARAHFITDYAAMLGVMYEPYWLKCDAYSAFNQRGQTAIDPACITKHGEGGVFLWGDSHAQAMSLGLRTLLPKETAFYQVASAGCKPSLTSSPSLDKTSMRTACNYSNNTALDSIRTVQPDVVLIVQKDDHDKTDWSKISARLKSYGVKHVVLVGPLPEWNPSLPSVIANRHWGTTDSHITDPALDQDVMVTDHLTQKTIDHKAVDFISLIDKLCVANSCLVRLPGDNSLLQLDSSHLTEKGSVYIVKTFVLPELEKLN
ncbi:SGNH hydrolase domain-containing protein, partial [Pseudomonas sp. AB12(2023)]|uniref:SGNH hydrolase domain-containing protein n=1 Tax=Pseudomonas sp. AB12(2023) TaxID=3048597 RepID=UPI002B226D06